MKCDFCGSIFELAAIEKLYAEKNAQAEQAKKDADAKAAAQQAAAGQGGVTPLNPDEATDETATEGSWDTGETGGWGQDANGVKVYTCPSCGAELICDNNTAATSCPYCNNPTIIPGQLGGSLKPDLVIPFKIRKEQALEALKNHYKGKPFLPDAFRDNNHLEEIKGIYIPFWLFNGTASGSANYLATQTHVRRQGDYEVTQTLHFNVYRSGNVNFENIPVDGSQKMDDDYMDSIEPFNYEDLKPFSLAYLPGYYADKYDVDADACSSRADSRAAETLKDLIRSTVVGYSTVIPAGMRTTVRRGKVHYALLPVWMLRTKWEGNTYTFAMNGQTGKLVGDLPSDPKKKRGLFWKVDLITLAVCAALLVPYIISVIGR